MSAIEEISQCKKTNEEKGKKDDGKVGQSKEMVLRKTDETAENVFAGSRTLARTPLQLNRAHSLAEIEDSLGRTREDEDTQKDNGKEKRKRQEGDTPPQLMKKRLPDKATSSSEGVSRKIIDETDWIGLRHKLKVVSKLINEVARQVKLNVNTKVEIKKGSTSLKQAVHVLEKMFDEVETEMEDEVQPTLLTKSTRNIGIQVEGSNIREDQQRIQDENKKLITEVLQEGTDFIDLTSILDITWPEDVYKATTLDNRDFISLENRDLVMFAQGGENDSITNRVAERYPEFMELMVNHDEQLPVDFMKFTTKIYDRTGVSGEKDSLLIAMRLSSNEEGFYDMVEVHGAIKELKDLVTSMERKHLAVFTPNGLPPEHLRRVMEYIYRDSGIDIMLTPTKERKSASDDEK